MPISPPREPTLPGEVRQEDESPEDPAQVEPRTKRGEPPVPARQSTAPESPSIDDDDVEPEVSYALATKQCVPFDFLKEDAAQFRETLRDNKQELAFFSGLILTFIFSVLTICRLDITPMSEVDAANLSWYLKKGLGVDAHLMVGMGIYNVSVLLAWKFLFFRLAEEKGGSSPALGVRTNIEMAFVYVSLSLFLFSAKILGLAPEVRFYSFVPFVFLAIICLQIEKHYVGCISAWRFTFAVAPMMFLVLISREMHVIIAGLGFSAMEFNYNAPPKLGVALADVSSFILYYICTLLYMAYFYATDGGGFDVAMNPPVEWGIEMCFLMFIIPFRVPILYHREHDKMIIQRHIWRLRREAAKKTEGGVKQQEGGVTQHARGGMGNVPRTDTVESIDRLPL